ncbi:MAG: helix-turn-helix domain-containing protein [Deltaproteobacteria bacterium]|nr:helix-turn-helix domain-containing protein [Deltaproteobacteria bacterium]
MTLGRVLERRLTQAQAARQLGLSVRQVERLCRELRIEGPRGLVSKKRRRGSAPRSAGAVSRGARPALRAVRASGRVRAGGRGDSIGARWAHMNHPGHPRVSGILGAVHMAPLCWAFIAQCGEAAPCSRILSGAPIRFTESIRWESIRRSMKAPPRFGSDLPK